MPAIEPGRLAGGIALVSTAALFLEEPSASGTLVSLGLCWVVLGAAALFIAERRQVGASRKHLALASLAALALGVAAILSSDSARLGNPMPTGHVLFLGAPHHLAWFALYAAALRLRDAPHDGRARQLWALSTLWALGTLWMPMHTGGQAQLPLWAYDGWLGTVLCLTSLAAVCRMLPWLTPIDLPRLDRLGLLSGCAPIALGLAHLITLVRQGANGSAWLTALALFAALGALTIQLAKSLEVVAEDLSAPKRNENTALLLPGLILSTFLVLKTHGMGASVTDENIYFYMASKLSEGQWPYVDYFFAHPPLHVLLPGLLFSITGFSLVLAKAIAPLACAVSGGALWSIARRHFGPVAACVSLISFLFATEVLKASTNMTGINLTVMWMMLGLRDWTLDRPRRAGVFFAAALSTGIYAAAAVCAAIALGAFRSRRFVLELLVATAALFGLVNLVGWAVAPDTFLEGVYQYHGLKAPDAEGYMPLFSGESNPISAWLHNLALLVQGRPFTKELFYHAHLWVAGALVPLVALAQCVTEHRRQDALRDLSPTRLWTAGARGRAALLWWVAVSLFAQFALFRELYSFYFVLIYPVLALCLGWVVTASLELVATAVSQSWPVRTAVLKAASGALLFAAFLSWESVAYDAQARAFPKEVQATGTRVAYSWKPAPVLSSLSPLVQHLFWNDHRRKGEMERGYRHYLWNKKRALVSLPEIAEYIRAHSDAEDTIAGSSTIAPLLALASDRRLAADEADTNTKRFRTGVLDEASYWESICSDRVKFIVSTSRSFFTPRRMREHPMIKRWFRLVKRFDDPEIRHGGKYPILLFERIRPVPVDGRVCQ